MNLVLRTFASSVIIAFALGVSASAPPQQGRAFDEFGDINCEGEMARLDNFTVNLLGDPNSEGAILFYSGQTFRGRLPRRGDGAARAARLKTYLVSRRGVPADKIIMIDGGYEKEWRAILWIVPPGAAALPTPRPTIPANQIKFRKGKASARDFRCRI